MTQQIIEQQDNASDDTLSPDLKQTMERVSGKDRRGAFLVGNATRNPPKKASMDCRNTGLHHNGLHATDPAAPARQPRQGRGLRTIFATAALLAAISALDVHAQAPSPVAEIPFTPDPRGGAYDGDGKQYPYLPSAVAVGDLNGDGIPDMAVAVKYPQGTSLSFTTNTICILIADGHGGFIQKRSVPYSSLLQVSGGVSSIAIGDVNGDGVADIVLGGGPVGVWDVLLGDGNGGYREVPPPSNVVHDGAYVQLADLNKDGNLDIILSGADAGSPLLPTPIAIGLGDGRGNFSFQTLGVSAWMTKVGDFNGDGIPDLAFETVNYTWTLFTFSIMFGDGNGGMSQPFTVFQGVQNAFAVADLNGDGKSDLVVAGNGGTIEVLLSDGTGNFTRPGPSYVSGYQLSFDLPGLIAIGDFNGDGYPDIAVANNGQSFGASMNPESDISLLLGNGTGIFTPSVRRVPSAGAQPGACAAADFNQDGVADLACVSLVDGYLRLLFGNRTFSVNPHSIAFNAAAASGAPPPITVAVTPSFPLSDFSVTSTPAWLTASPVADNTGNVGQITISANPGSLAAGTYSGSIQLQRTGYVGPSINVTFTVSNPAGTLRSAPVSPGSGDATVVAAGDLNGDGKADLVVATQTGVTAYLNDGTGHFAPKTLPALAPGGISDIVIGDFNGDGYADIALTRTGLASDQTSVPSNFLGLQMLLGDGAGNFTFSGSELSTGGAWYQSYSSWAGPMAAAMAAGDFNGDGLLDLVVQNAWVPVNPSFDPQGIIMAPQIFLNDADGFVSSVPQYPANSTPRPQGDTNIIDDYHASVAVGDINGDGKLDIVTAYETPSVISPAARVFLGQGDGSFIEGNPVVLQGQSGRSVALADLNGDGNLDMVIGTAASTVVFLGDGRGGFTLAQSMNVAAQSLAVGDFNGDGVLDIAAVSDGGLWVLIGAGNGQFTPQTGDFNPPATETHATGFMAMADFNADGRADLIVPAPGNALTMFGDAVPTVGTLSTAAAASVSYDAPIPLTLTISPSMPAFNWPSGAGASATFLDGATNLGTVSQNTGSYQFNAAGLAPGMHTLTAQYSGNARNVGSTSNTITIEVASDGISSGTGPASPFNSPGLAQNQMLTSANGTYQAVMQSDGNFVIYASGTAIWSTQTQGRQNAPYRLAVQPDGNLVIYGSSSQDTTLPGFGVCVAYSPCIATWFTGLPGGIAPYLLRMQNDGNLVLYDSTFRAVWFSGTQR